MFISTNTLLDSECPRYQLRSASYKGQLRTSPIDTDKEDFYKNDKVYEDSSFTTLKGHNKSYLYIMNRAIDDRGAGRADYAMMTDEVIKDKSGNSILFFSARHYHLYDTAKTLDIFKSGGSATIPTTTGI